MSNTSTAGKPAIKILVMKKFFASLLFVSLCVAVAGEAFAQGDLIGGSGSAGDLMGSTGRVKLAASPSGGGASRRRRNTGGTAARPPAANVRVVTRTVVERVTPTTGSLSVASNSRADIYVTPLGGGETRKGTIPNNERLFVFNELPPGKYRVVGELNDHEGKERTVEIVRSKATPLTLDLQPFTYEVTITTNVPTGEVRYQRKGEVDRIIPIENSRAVLRDLRAGQYEVDIRSGEVGYQTLLATIDVDDDKMFPVELKKQLSTRTFSALWTSLEGWDMPASWKPAQRKLSVKDKGIGLPRDETFRYYSDFQLISDVKMLNGVAASFVLRAADAKNHYLIQITGAKSDEPFVLRSFIVKNGVAQRLAPSIPVDGFMTTLKQGQFFTVSMMVKGNQIAIEITDSETGQSLPLGTLNDPNNNFKIGAVGIAVRDNEQNEIGRFTVCNGACPKG